MLKIMFNIDIIYQLLDIKIWGPNALALVAAPGQPCSTFFVYDERKVQLDLAMVYYCVFKIHNGL
jgi:hypothetical protein